MWYWSYVAVECYQQYFFMIHILLGFLYKSSPVWPQVNLIKLSLIISAINEVWYETWAVMRGLIKVPWRCKYKILSMRKYVYICLNKIIIMFFWSQCANTKTYYSSFWDKSEFKTQYQYYISHYFESGLTEELKQEQMGGALWRPTSSWDMQKMCFNVYW